MEHVVRPSLRAWVTLLLLAVSWSFFAQEKPKLQSKEIIRPERPSPTPFLVFFKNGQPVARPLARPVESSVTNPSLELRLSRMLVLWLEGPTAEEASSGLSSPWPKGTQFDRLSQDNQGLNVWLTLSQNAFRPNLDPGTSDALVLALTNTVGSIAFFPRINLMLRRVGDNQYQNLNYFLPPPEPLAKKQDSVEIERNEPMVSSEILSPEGVQPPAYGQDRPAGSLSGKTIFVSAGHGWYHDTGTGNWTTQRGNTHSLVEDFHTAETVDDYLIHYLWNAGADVWTMRERSKNLNELIVDNDGSNTSGAYSETGSWINSSLTGFGHITLPYNGSTDPFEQGGNRLLAISTGAATGSAAWTFTISESGLYPVYVSYSTFSSRAPDAHFRVSHSGGQSDFSIDQTIHGFTWRYLGSFWFEAGAPSSEAKVELFNDSAVAGKYVSADAVRLGAGPGVIDRGDGVSGRPKFEECSRYYAQYMGAPASVYQTSVTDRSSDVTARPRFAEFEVAAGEDAVYVSLHSNAPDPGTGTSSFIYDGGATTGSSALQGAIHDELINDIRAGWDAGWTDRGKQLANFGELRLLSSMPGTLIELAFHDTAADASDLKQPEFRMVASRAITQGIIRYFNVNGVLPPEPPQAPWLEWTNSGSVTVHWSAPPTDGLDLVGDNAASYKVYLSSNGKGFDNGTAAASTSLILSGLDPAEDYGIRISSLNTGGESFPTETLFTRANAEPARLLIVNGFDRLDGSALIPRFESAALGTISRMILERMNTFDYGGQFSSALEPASLSWVSTSNEAVISTAVNLNDYCGVMWILGEESSADSTFDATEQARVSSYLNNGGHLFVSGSELGWDLDALNNGRTFFETGLKADYLDDDVYTGASPAPNLVSGITGSIFAGLSGIFFDNGTDDLFNVDWPDVFAGNDGGTLGLNYDSSGEASTGAGVVFDGSSKVVTWGFPFEAIPDLQDRQDLMDRILTFFTFDATPTTASDMAATGTGSTVLSWSAMAGSLDYLVFRSTDSQGPWQDSTDITNQDLDGDNQNTSFSDPSATPTSGQVFFYQARGRNCSGSGS